jgi:UTP-glucose-1-phosphate uridylyltransferase
MSQKITKAVFPVAGLGTRSLPAVIPAIKTGQFKMRVIDK